MLASYFTNIDMFSSKFHIVFIIMFYSFSFSSDLHREKEALENKLLACKEKINTLNEELSIRIRYALYELLEVSLSLRHPDSFVNLLSFEKILAEQSISRAE